MLQAVTPFGRFFDGFAFGDATSGRALPGLPFLTFSHDNAFNVWNDQNYGQPECDNRGAPWKPVPQSVMAQAATKAQLESASSDPAQLTEYSVFKMKAQNACDSISAYAEYDQTGYQVFGQGCGRSAGREAALHDALNALKNLIVAYAAAPLPGGVSVDQAIQNQASNQVTNYLTQPPPAASPFGSLPIVPIAIGAGVLLLILLRKKKAPVPA
jgi:hypothetical protein